VPAKSLSLPTATHLRRSRAASGPAGHETALSRLMFLPGLGVVKNETPSPVGLIRLASVNSPARLKFSPTA